MHTGFVGGSGPSATNGCGSFPSYELWQFGLELMEKAEGPDGGSPFARAGTYRSGLMVSLLAARPLRRRNFASIEIGRHLVKEGDQYSLHFEGAETKTGVVIDNPFPATLVPYLERYLTHYRPFLAQRTGRWKNRHPSLRPPGINLWVSDYASAMSEGAIYEQIRNLTRAKFGRGLGPHMFRDCAATSVATEDPEHVLIVPSLLGHSSPQTSQEYYDHAQSNYAVSRYQQFVLAQRRARRCRWRPRWSQIACRCDRIFRPQSQMKAHPRRGRDATMCLCAANSRHVRNTTWTPRGVGRPVEGTPFAAKAEVQRACPAMCRYRIPSPGRLPCPAPGNGGRAGIAGARGAPFHRGHPADRLRAAL